jgi:hypothetical protein
VEAEYDDAFTAFVAARSRHLLGREVAKVVVHMKDGRDDTAAIVDGAGFRRSVWSAIVQDELSPVRYYAGYDASGAEVARQAAEPLPDDRRILHG